MARDIVAPKSFRTVVGTLDPGGLPGGTPLGSWLLDTNDTSRYFGFFVFFNGEPEKSVFVTEYLKKKFSMYADVFQRGDLSKPQALMRETLAEMLREMDNAGLGATDADSLAVMLVKEGVVVIGRLNACPVYFLRDRKFRQLFLPGKTGGQKLEVEAYYLADHDRILMCTENVTRRLTKLELRNILATEADLDLACSKIATLAGRYEELVAPKMVLVGFKRNHEINKALFNRRNIAVFSGLAAMILVLLFWREIGNFTSKLSFKWPTRQTQEEQNKDGGFSKGSMYQLEEVYNGLAVPYDVAVDPGGVLYIVDDKESQVIRYDPSNKRVSLVGNGLELGFPTGIDIAGNKLYVTDFAGRSSMLYVLQTDGQVLARVQALPGQPGDQLRKPKAVAVDANGQVWVADRSNNRLVQFDLLGKYVRSINLSPQFKSPNGVAFGPAPQNEIYTTLKDSDKLLRVSRDGRMQKPAEIYTSDRLQVEFNQPAGVAVDSNGFIYVADRENSRIIVADPVGKVNTIIDKNTFADFGTYSPFGLKIGQDQKYLYVAGSTHASYDDICTASGKCHGKVWRMRIGG